LDGEAEAAEAMSHRRLRLLIACAVLALAGLAATAQASPAVVLRAEINGDDQSRIVLKVEVKDGRPVGGSIDVQRVRLTCGDQRPYASLGKAKLDFIDRKRFVVDRYLSGSASGIESYLRARGKVNLRKGTADGAIGGFVNPLDRGGGESTLECDLAGYAFWHAPRSADY
jgi:hypothetical protein